MSASDTIVISDRAQLVAFQTHVVEQLATVGRVEHENVIRRVFIGFAFRVIKDSMERGTFLPWLKSRAAGFGYTQCTYMMRLADEWLAKARPSAAQISALTSNNFSIETRDAVMRRNVNSVEKFVGKLSWSELLAKYDIKDSPKLGGARPKPAKNGTAPDAKQLELFALDSIGQAIDTAERVLLRENQLVHIRNCPDAVRGVVESLRALADKVEQAAKPLLKPARAAAGK